MTFDLKAWLFEQAHNHDLPITERTVAGLQAHDQREWLVTNALGSYAAGSLSGANTRRYHGLFIASHNPPVQRVQHLAHLDETIRSRGKSCALATNLWKSGAVAPEGHLLIESFSDLPVPTWCYKPAGGRLIKQVLMRPGDQHVYVGYTWLPDDSQSSAELEIAVLVNYRDFHSQTRGAPDWHFGQEIAAAQLPTADSSTNSAPDIAVAHTSGTLPTAAVNTAKISAYGEAVALYLQTTASYEPAGSWYKEYYWPREFERGLEDSEDCYHCGRIKISLAAGQSFCVAAGLSPVEHWKSIETLVQEVAAHKVRLLERADSKAAPAKVKRLVLAADHFLVKRQSTDGMSIIAGYPWFSDWGRDSMIALSGLCLSTGKTEEARSILATFARYLSNGMLPNFFPDNGQEPAYNTSDATFWWAYALYRYHKATGDTAFIAEQLSLLRDVIDWHRCGTRHGLIIDTDSLITGGNENIQLTWMDAKCGVCVFTPRAGKAVEINALWYNFMRTVAYLHRVVYKNMTIYGGHDIAIQEGFAKFWLGDKGYFADVIRQDGTIDTTIRPNQILAASLTYPVVSKERAQQMLAVVEQHLLTEKGLRTLSPQDPQYQGRYGMGKTSACQFDRDKTYHQGTVWPWLLGPWVNARIYAYGETEENFAFIRGHLKSLLEHLENEGCIGSISEIFDGDAPHKPQGCGAQAWSVAELLRVLREYPALAQD